MNDTYLAHINAIQADIVGYEEDLKTINLILDKKQIEAPIKHTFTRLEQSTKKLVPLTEEQE